MKSKIKIALLALGIIAIIALALSIEPKKDYTTRLLSMELNCNKENIKTYNLLENKNYSLILIRYHYGSNTVWLIHRAKKFHKDKLIFLYPEYRIKEISRKAIFSQRYKNRDAYKVVE